MNADPNREVQRTDEPASRSKLLLAARGLTDVARRPDTWLKLGLAVGLPLIESLALLWNVVSPSGFVFYGDVVPIVNPSRTFIDSFTVYGFQSYPGASESFIWLPVFGTESGLGAILGPSTTSRVMPVIVAAAPAMAMFLATMLLLPGLTRLSLTRVERVYVPLLASQAYFLSFVNDGLTNPMTPWSFSYIALPLILSGFWTYAVTSRKLGLIVALFGTIASSLNPFWIEASFVLIVPALVLQLLSQRTVSSAIQVLRRTAIILGMVILANMFWIAPLLSQYFLGAATYTGTSETNSAGYVLFLSRGFTLKDVLFLGHSTYVLNGTWNQNYSVLSLFPILATFLAIGPRRRNTSLLMGLVTTFVLSLFLAKGANPPLGQIYVSLADSLPLGFGRYLSNGGGIFLEVSLASASPLMGIGIVRLCRGISQSLMSRKLTESVSKRSTFAVARTSTGHHRHTGHLLVGVLVASSLLVLTPLAQGTVIDQQVYIPRFQATPVPGDYSSAVDYLTSQRGPFNVVWTPNGCCLGPSWKQQILTDFPQSITFDPELWSPSPALDYLNVQHNSLTGQWLSLLGARYVLAHSDVPGFPYQSVNDSLSHQQGLQLVGSFGAITVYEVEPGAVPATSVYALPTGLTYLTSQANLTQGQYLQVGNSSTVTLTLNATEPDAADFSGIGYAVSTAPVSFASNENFTVAAWVRTSVGSGTQVVAQDGVYGGYWDGWILGLQDGEPWFQVGQAYGTPNQGVTGNTSIADGTWHFLVGERQGTNISLYVDGQRVANRTNIPSIAVGSGQNASFGARVMSFGAQAWGFFGSLANIQVYSRALEMQEIGDLESSGLSGKLLPDASDGWLFEQQSGASILNLIDNAPSLMLVNTSWVPGPFFLSDAISTRENFTVAAWVRTSVGSGTQVVAQDGVYGGYWDGWILGLQDGEPWFQVGQAYGTPNQGVTGNTSIADGTWHFLVGERQGTNISLYVDGQRVANRTNIPPIAVGDAQKVSIGARVMSFGAQAWNFTGYMANVELFSGPLTSAQVVQLYSQGLNPNATQQIGLNPVFLTLVANPPSPVSTTDTSGNEFPIDLRGTLLPSIEPLPVNIASSKSSRLTISVIDEISPDSYTLSANVNGSGTLVLAEPFAKGWECQYGNSDVAGASLFGGLAIQFNVSGYGSIDLRLDYTIQSALVAGTVVSLVGTPIAISLLLLLPGLRGRGLRPKRQV